MNCPGCYKEVKDGYCLTCRKKMFGKAKVTPMLDFDSPRTDNLDDYQDHSKRLSISGVQLKYSLRLNENKLALTDAGGEYILKPIPPARQLVNIEEMPENEHLTMQIAAQVFGISTATNALILFNDQQPAYITKRFDVKSDSTKHMQEDFAQLTNRTRRSHGEHFKYDGSYEEIGMLIKQFVAAAMPAMEQFFKLVLFNYIISNGDAHLKNFSLMRADNGEYLLTPAYDLISTVIHTPQESDTALDLYEGDIKSAYYEKYGHYGRENFMELARRLGIIEQRAERIIASLTDKEDEVKQMVYISFLSEATKERYVVNFMDKVRRMDTKLQ